MALQEKQTAATIHIGKLIQDKILEKRLTYAAVSKLINVAPSTLTAYFENSSLQSRIIQKLSIALEYNFFEDITNSLPESIQNTNSENQKKLALQKQEVEELKKEISIYKELLKR